MSFLTINGWALTVKEGSGPRGQEVIGDVARSFAGNTRTQIRARKALIDIETPPLSILEGEALGKLLEGEGHRWSFDGTTVGSVDSWYYSSRGLGKTSGTITRATAAPAAKFGAAYAQIAMGAVVTWTTPYTGDSTLMVWLYDGAAWVHYIVRSDGAKWVDGVRNDAASTPFLTISGAGVVTLGDVASVATQKFDDLVVLGFKAGLTMAASWGTAALAFSDLPALRVAGDVVPNTIIVRVTDSVDMDRLRATVSGASAAAIVVSATLEQST